MSGPGAPADVAGRAHHEAGLPHPACMKPDVAALLFELHRQSVAPERDCKDGTSGSEPQGHMIFGYRNALVTKGVGFGAPELEPGSFVETPRFRSGRAHAELNR